MGSQPERLSLFVWRISNHVVISGRGGLAVSGRWHTHPKLIVYCSDEPHTAYCEVLRHLGSAMFFPKTYTLLEIATTRRVHVESVDPEALDPDWSLNGRKGWAVCQPVGNAWAAASETPILRVPSAVRLGYFNYLPNPVHRDVDDFSIVRRVPAPFPGWVSTPSAQELPKTPLGD